MEKRKDLQAELLKDEPYVEKSREEEVDGTRHAREVRVIVLGSGFAGMSFVKSFTKHLSAPDLESVKLKVISRRNYHLFTPLLYQVATGLTDEHHVIDPIENNVRKLHYSVTEAEVESLDLVGRVVKTSEGAFPYDYLIIALGSVSNDFGIRGVMDNAVSLKSLQDAERIRNAIIQSFEKSTLIGLNDPMFGTKRSAALTFVVVGGGATGVELAGSIRDFTKLLSRKYYPVGAREVQVVLLEALDRLVPEFRERLSIKCRESLESAGVEVKLGARVVEVAPTSVVLSDGTVIETQNVFWTAGTRANPVLESLSNLNKRKGRLVTDGFLRAENLPNLYVVGDDAWIGQAPPTAAAAVQEGDYVGRQLASLIEGKRFEKPFEYRDRGSMLSLGRFVGLAQFHGGVVVTGFLGWALWRMVHLARIATMRNRLGVMLDWSLSLMHRRIVSRTD